MLDQIDFMERLMRLIPLILSLSVHEFAHAWSAYKLGDDTAERDGRLTLNPLAHIDLLGTILLPLFSPIPFGWARPVPVNPLRFDRRVTMRTGMMLTAAAGPISNILIALAMTVGLGLAYRWFPAQVEANPALKSLAVTALFMNVNLAIFNLLPVPPLDGSRIADRFMPERLRPMWESFSTVAPMLLIVVLAVGGYVIAGPVNAVNDLLLRLFSAIQGR